MNARAWIATLGLLAALLPCAAWGAEGSTDTSTRDTLLLANVAEQANEAKGQMGEIVSGHERVHVGDTISQAVREMKLYLLALDARDTEFMDYVSQAASQVAAIDPSALFRRQYDWVAVETEDFTTANADGSLSVWQPDWYITHDWSDYGAVISDFQPGDAVTVNGVTTLILDKSEWAKNVYTDWDVYEVVGWDKTVFQTCLGDDKLWIAIGRTVHPSAEFLEQHPPQE